MPLKNVPMLVVLCGGLATRLGALTRETPKILLPFNGKPFIHHFVEQHVENGFSEFVFITGHKSEQICDYLPVLKNEYPNKKFVAYNEGSNRLGTGGAVRAFIALLGDEFALTYGDSYLVLTQSELQCLCLPRLTPSINMLIYENADKFDISNVEVNNSRMVTQYEKNRQDKYNFIDTGMHYFYKADEIFSKFNNVGSSLDLTIVLDDSVKLKKMFGVVTRHRFHEIGSTRGINDFREYLERL